MSIGSWLQKNIIGGDVDYSAATNAANDLLADRDKYAAQEGQVFNQEQGLTGQLENTINGTGPSIARAQLAQGQGDIARQFASSVSGARGSGGALARYGANEGMGEALGKGLQTGVLGRILEQKQAQDMLRSLLGNMGVQAGGMYNTDTSGGLNALGLEMSGRNANAAANQQAFAALTKAFTDAAGVFGGGGSGGSLSGGGSGGGGGGGGGIMGGGGGSLIGGGDNGGGDSLAKYGSLMALA